jgi:sucrose phosphorylase
VNRVTVLDTHDGIGVIDAGPDTADPRRVGLLTREQIGALIEAVHTASGGR